MGSASSKFRKCILNGDEYAAMQVICKMNIRIWQDSGIFIFGVQIYQNSPELRKTLDPNLSYGEQHLHNTAMHVVSKHGMKHLLR